MKACLSLSGQTARSVTLVSVGEAVHFVPSHNRTPPLYPTPIVTPVVAPTPTQGNSSALFVNGDQAVPFQCEAAVDVVFPQVYGGRMWVVGVEAVLLSGYLFLAIQSAREHPQ